MIPLTPALLIAAAGGFVGLRERVGGNRGLMIDLFLRHGSQPPGQPWCAAFVHHVGCCSHLDHRTGKSSWPVPSSASCARLGEFARLRHILHEHPAEGDVFLLWSPGGARYAHTGIVVGVRQAGATPAGRPWFDCDTIEGTSADESNGRWGVLRRPRRFYPDVGDRFVRWVDLDGRKPAPVAPSNRAA